MGTSSNKAIDIAWQARTRSAFSATSFGLPQIPLVPQLDSGMDSVRRLSKSGGLDNHERTAARRRPSLEEQDSIDLDVDSLGADLNYRPQSVSHGFRDADKPSRATAVASAIR
jgi:hypothetical protein